MFKVFS